MIDLELTNEDKIVISSLNAECVDFNVEAFGSAFQSASIRQEGAARFKEFEFDGKHYKFSSFYGYRTRWSGWRDSKNNVKVLI